jgi:hypothetical protein
MRLWPTEVDEKYFLFGNLSLEAPSLPNLSSAQWSDLRFGGTFWKRFSRL